jgi:hypothetical protein
VATIPGNWPDPLEVMHRQWGSGQKVCILIRPRRPAMTALGAEPTSERGVSGHPPVRLAVHHPVSSKSRWLRVPDLNLRTGTLEFENNTREGPLSRV